MLRALRAIRRLPSEIWANFGTRDWAFVAFCFIVVTFSLTSFVWHKPASSPVVSRAKSAELVYHGSTTCPQCGRAPVKPPRSIFAAPPVESTSEILPLIWTWVIL